jgi:dienelactone hydrolase
MLTKVKPELISIPLKDVVLKGNLYVPQNARGLVLFSHGSGSSRLSPRNTYVAGALQKQGLATLLFDLLTAREDESYETRFNIDLLTKRLIAVTQWVREQPKTGGLSVGYFGASTGAASALRAASYFGKEILAIVSKGGRPDLALSVLHNVTAPTLLIVGEWDTMVIELNQKAYAKLGCERKLEIVPGAGHLFEERGKLEKVAKLSSAWFIKRLDTNSDSYVQG